MGRFNYFKITFCGNSSIYDSQIRIVQDIQYRDQISQDAEALFEADLTDDRYLKIVRENREVFQTRCFSESMCQYMMKFVLPEFQEDFLEKYSLKSLLDAYREGKQYLSFLFRQIDCEGRTSWIEAVTYLWHDEVSGHIHSFTYLRNIEEVMVLVQEAGVTMRVDPLTVVMQKREFEVLVRYLLKRPDAHDHAVMLTVDMDEFEKINDFFGKEYGDEVLANAASIIKAATPLHTVTGRIGGDKFCIYIYQYSSRKDVSKMVENLVRHLFTAFLSGTAIRQITASVGISYVEDVGNDYDTLLSEANEFMYHLKHRS